MRNFTTVFLSLIFSVIVVFPPVTVLGAVEVEKVPSYVTAGLQEYETKGYEAAVQVWLADSPYKNATTLASSIAFFQNIEKLAGQYLSYDILMTKETISSNVVYVRMNYKRLPGYILFTSMLRDGKWVLARVNLDKRQRFGVAK